MSHSHQEKDPLKRQQKNLQKIKKRNNLLRNIKDETFCKLGVSGVAGIGVIALKTIPKGTKIFKCCNEELFGSDEPIEISDDDLAEVEDLVLEYADNFMVKSAPDMRPFPSRGFNSININFYLNHSNNPNVEFIAGKTLDDFVEFVTSKEVKEGEELTQDYNNLSNDKSELLKQFPFLSSKK